VVSTLGERVALLPDGGDTPALLDRGFPGSWNGHPYSYPVLQRLARLAPGAVEVDWDALETETPLMNALALLLTPGECQGLDDVSLSTAEWIGRCREGTRATDLEFVLSLFDAWSATIDERTYLFESCGLTQRYAFDAPGLAAPELRLSGAPTVFQRRPPRKDRAAVAPRIRRAPEGVRHLPQEEGERVLDLAVLALAARNREISSLLQADARDVTLVTCGRGVTVALLGVLPECRDALECTFLALLLKNGVPVGYGPAVVCLGTTEMGIHLFPEFRGAEVRFLYVQLMRALHHVLGAVRFRVTSYGMGRGNPEALRSGAFWFYRKLGFGPTNPAVEALAREEERRLAAEPGARSSLATLRRLSDTEVVFELERGAPEPPDLGRLGVLESRLVERRFGGRRPTALRGLAAEAARRLGGVSRRGWTPGERRGFEILSPLVSSLPGVEGWSAREKARLQALMREKGARSERAVDRGLRTHAPFLAALRRLLGAGTTP
jgi:hypothetical protein